MSKNHTVAVQNNHSKEKVEQDRLRKFHEKSAKSQSPISYQEKIDGNITRIETKVNNKTIVLSKFNLETVKADLCAATGTASEEYGRLLLSQTISGFSNNHGATISNATAVHEALLAMAPADEHEGMLCSRLLVLHNQAMDFMRRSATTNHDASIDLNINRAIKLMRLHNETLEALNRYRRKGEQRITIQHVQVNDGGQAIVAGEMSRGGGDVHKKQQE